MVRAILSVAAVAGVVAGAAACASGARATAADIHLAKEHDIVSAVVPEDATFETLLRAQHVDPDTAQGILGAIKSAFNPRALRAAQPYQLVRTLDGIFQEFRYDIDSSKFLRVMRRGAADHPEFAVDVVEYPREIEEVAASAEITAEHSNLTAAFEAGGENIQLALLLSEVFGGVLDFNSDLQRGDRFDVLFERVLRDGEFSGYGDVSAARLRHGGKIFTAVRVAGPDGKAAWYDENGRSMRRQMLASPLPFNPRITSRFSTSRKHPILGYNRAHLGVDYGAPYGTRVLAVSDGTVVSAEFSGQSGRMVHLRHPGGFETYYLHLSSFAAGIVPGAHVSQGDVIGRVGATGAATGPHLDFRIRRNGTFVNPVLERQRNPPGEPIPPSMLSVFQSERDRALTELTRRLAAVHSKSAEH